MPILTYTQSFIYFPVNVPLDFDDEPPKITIDTAAINAVCLTSQAAAEALILEKTTVTDNCTPANQIVKTIVHFEENCAFTRGGGGGGPLWEQSYW